MSLIDRNVLAFLMEDEFFVMPLSHHFRQITYDNRLYNKCRDCLLCNKWLEACLQWVNISIVYGHWVLYGLLGPKINMQVERMPWMSVSNTLYIYHVLMEAICTCNILYKLRKLVYIRSLYHTDYKKRSSPHTVNDHPFCIDWRDSIHVVDVPT